MGSKPISPIPPPSGPDPSEPFGPPKNPPPQPAADETVVHVPVPEGTVDLLDPAVIAEEVKRGDEQNAAEYGKE